MPLENVIQTQHLLYQALVHKNWESAIFIIVKYERQLEAVKITGQSLSTDEFFLLEQQNRRMVRMLFQAIQYTKEDIASTTQAIDRLERGKIILSSLAIETVTVKAT